MVVWSLETAMEIVTYFSGDFAMWRYANDILKGVEIQSVFPSSSLIPTYRYSFKILTDETMMHDTWHANLFIPVLSGNII